MAGAPGRSGGQRSGKPGQGYPQRTDLNALPVRTTTNQPYGVAGAQQQAQRAVPMAAPPSPRATPLSAPTTRPAEPITSGLSTGPGPGPEVLGNTGIGDGVDLQLRALYALYPTNDLLGLLEELDRGAGQF